MLIQKLFSLFILIGVLISCSRETLTVHIDYLSRDNLASAHVRTPDPLYENPPVGQKLVISWTIPHKQWNDGGIWLKIDVRYKDHQQICHELRVLRRQGAYVIEVLNDDYFEKGGIRTYRIQLLQNGYLIDDWRHQLWAEWISFEKPEEDSDTIDFND